MQNHTLIIVGAGIKFMSHITSEAKACIEQADKVLYLVNEPAMQEWIQICNPRSESLDPIYTTYSAREKNYHCISEYVAEALKVNRTVCLVIYGHPTVLSQPAIYSANVAKSKGYDVIVQPGVSAEDSLY